jgi:hypothetical protein
VTRKGNELEVRVGQGLRRAQLRNDEIEKSVNTIFLYNSKICKNEIKLFLTKDD